MMRKQIFRSALALAVMIGIQGWIEAAPKITAGSVEVEKEGTGVLELSLSGGAEGYSGFNIKLDLPAGVTCVNAVAGTLVESGFNVYMASDSAGDATVLAYSSSETFSDSGTLVKLTLQAESTVAEGTSTVKLAANGADIVNARLCLANADGGTSYNDAVVEFGEGTITVKAASAVYTLTMAVDPSAGGVTEPTAGTTTSVTDGASQSIKATASSGYVFSSWTATDNATVADATAASTTVTLSGDATVTANFVSEASLANLTMAVSPDGGGTTSPTAGVSSVVNGTATTIIATATTGYVFSSWTATDNATVADATSASTTVTLSGDATVTANFASESSVVKLTMAVSPDGGGTTSPTAGVSSVVNGTATTIIATATTGYVFSSWTATENATVADATAASTTVTLSGDATVTANFVSESSAVKLTMAVSPDSGGTTSPTAGVSSIVNGTATTIIATATTGYTFSNWTATENATVADATAASTTVTLSGDATVTANFTNGTATEVSLTMAVSPDESGTTSPATGVSSVTTDTATTITATAADGYYFSGWTVTSDATVTDATASSTTVTLSGDATVTACFDKTVASSATLTMAVSPSDSGSSSPSESVSVPVGVPQSVSATAAEGYAFIGWTATVGATLADATSSPTTVTLSGDATVTAFFSTGKTTGELTVDKLSVGLRGDQTGKDKFSISLELPSDFSYVPLTDDLKILVGSWELKVEKGGSWKGEGKQSYSGLTDAGKTKIVIDAENKNILTATVSNASIAGKINSCEGVDVYLAVGESYYYENIDVDEKTSWKSTGSGKSVEGFDANVVKLKGTYVCKDGGMTESYSFSIMGTGLKDPTDSGFDDTIIPTFFLGQTEWEIDCDEVKNSKDVKFIYKVSDGSLKQVLQLDFASGKWKFSVKEKDSSYGLEMSKIGTVRSSLRFDGMNSSDVWLSVCDVPTAVRTTLNYKR